MRNDERDTSSMLAEQDALSRDDQQLLALIRVDDEAPRPTLLPRRAAAWSRLVDRAVEARVAWQVLSTVRRHRLHVPEEATARLEQAADGAMRATLRHAAAVHRLVAHEARVPLLLVKGLWLTEHVYRDPRARVPGDIDLVTHPDTMPALTAMLRDLGAAVPRDLADLRPPPPNSGEVPVRYPRWQVSLDVHWRMMPESITPEVEAELWRRAEPWSLAGRTVLSLSLEDHLLYLCAHVASHHRMASVGVRALLDIAQFTTTPPRPIDWEVVVARARRWGWERGAWVLLTLAKTWLGARVPDDAVDGLVSGPRPSHGALVGALESLIDTAYERERLSWLMGSLREPRAATRTAARLVRLVLPDRASLAMSMGVPDVAPRIYLAHVARWRFHARALGKRLPASLGHPRAYMARLKRRRALDDWLCDR